MTGDLHLKFNKYSSWSNKYINSSKYYLAAHASISIFKSAFANPDTYAYVVAGGLPLWNSFYFSRNMFRSISSVNQKLILKTLLILTCSLSRIALMFSSAFTN